MSLRQLHPDQQGARELWQYLSFDISRANCWIYRLQRGVSTRRAVERPPRPRTSTVRSIDLAQVVQNDTIVYNCPSCYYDSGQSLCWSAVYLQRCSSLVSSWPYCGKGKEVPFHLRVRALFLGTLCSSAALPLLFFSAFNKFAVQCRRL